MSTTNFNKQVVADIEFVKSILPESYRVGESVTLGSIHCVSKTGISEDKWNAERDKAIGDGHYSEWNKVFSQIKTHFGERFQEVYHNTCYCHVDFTIYLKPKSNL